jgi:hypothetical protein
MPCQHEQPLDFCLQHMMHGSKWMSSCFQRIDLSFIHQVRVAAEPGLEAGDAPFHDLGIHARRLQQLQQNSRDNLAGRCELAPATIIRQLVGQCCQDLPPAPVIKDHKSVSQMKKVTATGHSDDLKKSGVGGAEPNGGHGLIKSGTDVGKKTGPELWC